MVDLDDFVEMTKKYAQGMVPSAPQDGSQVPVKDEIPKDDDGVVEVKTNKQTKTQHKQRYGHLKSTKFYFSRFGND